MAEFKEYFPLINYNTFRVEATTRYFVEICNNNDINELIGSNIFSKNKRFIIGGGSNVLFTKDFDGLVIHPSIKGIDYIEETNKETLVKVGCGVIWDDFVQFAVENDLAGIENLSGIPGHVGACPVQNIGAYGTEVENVITKVEGIHLNTNKRIEFNHDQCKFGYRNSIFKKEYKNDFLITHVTFGLKKDPYLLNTSYTALTKELENYKEKNIKTVREIIKKIRGVKLPEVTKLGSAGSFFKNPVVAEEIASSILSKYPGSPSYKTENGMIKLSAAWLIDQSGCKGLQVEDATTYQYQPLVIVNKGKATGNDVLLLSKKIIEQVNKTFGILIEPEVNII